MPLCKSFAPSRAKRLEGGRMKKLVVLLLCAGLALSAAAREKSKPSAARMAVAVAPQPAEDSAVTETATAPASGISALPVGTAVRMKLETPISTMTNKAGDRFAGRIT